MVVGTLLSFLDIPTVCVFTIVLCVLYFISQNINPGRSPRGPITFPIVGNMPQLAGKKDLFKVFIKIQEKYGDIFRIDIGTSRFVVVMGAKNIRELMVDNGTSINERPNWIYIIEKIFKKKGVFWQNGAAWKELRRFTLVTLRDFGVGKSTLEEKILEEAVTMDGEIVSSKGQPIDIRRHLVNAVANIIAGVVFGERFDYNDPVFVDLQQKVSVIFKNAGLQIPENFFPFLRFFRWHSPAEKIIAVNEGIKAYVRQQIEEHEETFDADNLRDFVDMYIKVVKEGKHSEALSEENIFRAIVDLFVAGTETTATTVQWIILHMLHYPDVHKKCRNQIEKIVGSGRMVTWKDREALTYVMATIQEVQRISNIVPLIAPHVAVQDFELGGYIIAKGTVVLPHQHSAHNDKGIWGDPENFRPERWLTNDGKLKKFDAFLPFGVGPRMCIGESLAKMEIFLFFTNLLQRFSFHPTNTSEPLPTLEGHQSGATYQPCPFTMRAVEIK